MFRTKQQILRDLDPARPETVQALIDFHREAFGGYQMVEDGDADATDDKGGDGNAPEDQDDNLNLGEAGKRAIRIERDARKDLERQFAEVKSSLAEALGIKTKDAKSEDVVAELQKQIQDMQHDNLVFRVVTDPKHQITDEGDLELVKACKDEETMRRLATRLAKKADDTSSGTAQGRRFPRQDPNQGRGGGTEGRPTSVAAVRAERKAARAKRNT